MTLPELPLAQTWPIIPGGPTPIRVRRAGIPYTLAFDFSQMDWYLRGCTLRSALIGYPDAVDVSNRDYDTWITSNRSGGVFRVNVPGDYVVTCDPTWEEPGGEWRSEEVRGVLRIISA